MIRLMVLSLSFFWMSCGEKEGDTSGGYTEENADLEEDTSVLEEDTTVDTQVEESLINECDLVSLETTLMTLPSVAEEAGQLILIPDVGESYQLTKGAGAEGWFVLEVPTWMCDVELYTTESVSIELETSPDWELGDVAAPVSECEDSGLIRHSWTFHAWGSYVVHIDAIDTTELWLATRLVSAGPG